MNVSDINVSEHITRGKILLIQNQPFYASLVMRMEISETTEIDTACTDGTNIQYNPDFIGVLTIREVAGLLAHEVLHIALLHHTRRHHREPQRWNQACDYAINPILLKAGMSLPAGGLYNEDFTSMTAEQIYELLPPCDSATPAGFGEVKDPPGGAGKKEAAEAGARGSIAQALLDAKMRGNLPEDLERLVSQILQPKIDWREVLARFVTEISRKDYTWTRPAVRFIHQGLYMPMLEAPETGRIILIADTSGSIDDELISQFSGEVKGIADTFNISLLVIYVDAAVKATQEFEIGEDIDLKPRGGGGTDFRPGFVYIEDNDLQPRAVVYLTDGECSRYPDEPAYPVLWAQFGSGHFEPPFGEKIQITNH